MSYIYSDETFSIIKNRMGINNNIKIWGYSVTDLDSMEVGHSTKYITIDIIKNNQQLHWHFQTYKYGF